MSKNGPGNGSNDQTGHAAGVVDLAHLKAEIERLRTLKAEGVDPIEYEFEVRQVAARFGIGKRKFRQFVEGPQAGSDCRSTGQELPDSIEEAKQFVDAVKPELIVRTDDLPAAANTVRDLFATRGYFEWGGPAKVVCSGDGGLPQIVLLRAHNVVNEVHQWRRPVKVTPGGQRMAFTLPNRVAELYLAQTGEWGLPRLAGITTAPLLREDGGLRVAEGYDPETRLWCANMPVIDLPERPAEDQAREALLRLRAAFRTFPFADAERLWDAKLGLELVDLATDPARDESAFLCGLMTSVCRPCLHLAPGLMLVAPQLSGSGSGKGLLARAICLIAFGLQPAGFTPGKGGELEKRLASAFLEGGPVLFIDNVNNALFESPTLESAMTERPFRVRLFATLKMAVLDGAPFVMVTGNALTPSRDLVRRFAMFAKLDPKIENPALRRFPLPDRAFLSDIKRQRPELLSSVLTIWRYGRQNVGRLKAGLPLGSYSPWARWCRDPLLTLGCKDPVERIEEMATADPKRQDLVGIFAAWWKHHGHRPMQASDLHEEVKKLIDPEGVLQRIRPRLGTYDGTRLAGFEFRVDKDPKRKREPATYTLRNLETENR
jgi:putative DNA primase/helicase